MLKIENLIVKLFENFPEFKKSSNYDEEEIHPYNVIGDFALNFQDNYINSKLTSSQINKFFNFANEMAQSDDKEVQNIFVVEMLEIFSDRAETISIAREKLNANGKEMLERTLKGWSE